MSRNRLSSKGAALARRLARSGTGRKVAEAVRDDQAEARFDDWLAHYFDDHLSEIDASCAGAGPSAFGLFRDLDDDL